MLSVGMNGGEDMAMDRLNEAIAVFASQIDAEPEDIAAKIAEVFEKLATVEALRRRYGVRTRTVPGDTLRRNGPKTQKVPARWS